MTSNALIAFALCFGAGPALCAVLLNLPGKVWALLMLAVAVVLMATMALSYQLAGQAGQLGSLVLLWLAWVLAVAMVALALRTKINDATARRWILILALLATTLPWFGLATAQIMVGHADDF
jgi:hypothetical protein